MTQLVLDVIPKQPHPWWLVNPTSELAPRRRCVCGNTCSVLAGIGEVACPACGVLLPPRTQPLWCVYCWRVYVPALHFVACSCPGCGADLEETP